MNNETLLNNRYRILRELGSGGFGQTFLAEDTQMPSERRCVTKQLKPVTANPQIYQLVQERFAREAAILEELGNGHPQIPQLYAYFEENNQFYLVQEWIQGQTLTNRVQTTGQLSESSVKEILVSLLPVLEFVHSKHIVHRDIKPDNIILRQGNDKPVLIDFGAVRETMGTVMNSSGNSTSSIVIGTPGFMPSEQAAGRPVYSSDLYSLGLTAIYLLTGKWPQELQIDPQTGEIVWRQYAPRISPSLAGILDKAIASHPRDRYHSAREMLDALIAPTAPVAPPTIPSPLPIAASYSTSPTVISAATAPTVTSQGMGDWQKSAIAGTIIGAFVVFGLWIVRPQPTIITSDPSSQTSATNGSSDLSSDNPSDAIALDSPSPKSNSSASLNQPDPTQFVVDYYSNLNQRHYQKNWSNLSSNFKNISGSFPDYVEWWDSVREIRVGKVRVIDRNDRYALVDAELEYLMNDGQIIEDRKSRIYLSWDSNSKNWLFEDKYEP